jgi:hypothetical protein
VTGSLLILLAALRHQGDGDDALAFGGVEDAHAARAAGAEGDVGDGDADRLTSRRWRA